MIKGESEAITALEARERRSKRTPHKSMPNELIYEILKSVVDSTVHTICMSPDEVSPWHYHVMSTLCSVSYAFREITRELAIKAFAIKSEKELVLRVAHEKLRYLRTLGLQFREPLGHSLHSLERTDGSQLIQAYSLYMSASALRRNAIDQQEVADIFRIANELVEKALNNALQLCDRVMPRGVEGSLRRAVSNELAMVQISTSLARARIELEDSFRKMERLAEKENDDLGNTYCHVDSIKVDMDAAIGAIEEAEVRSKSIMQTECNFMPSLRYPILLFPNVLEIMRRCVSVEFDLDEYNIRKRASMLVEEWTAVTQYNQPPHVDP